jgi:hypothetical protein
MVFVAQYVPLAFKDAAEEAREYWHERFSNLA